MIITMQMPKMAIRIKNAGKPFLMDIDFKYLAPVY
jgi:hypothetical protein